MIISAANLFAVAVRELEYDSILLVHPDTVKTCEIASQLLQSIRRRHSQIVDGRAGVQQVKFLLHPAPEFPSNAASRFAGAAVINVGSRGIPEAGNHLDSIPDYPVFMYI